MEKANRLLYIGARQKACQGTSPPAGPHAFRMPLDCSKVGPIMAALKGKFMAGGRGGGGGGGSALVPGFIAAWH